MRKKTLSILVVLSMIISNYPQPIAIVAADSVISSKSQSIKTFILSNSVSSNPSAGVYWTQKDNGEFRAAWNNSWGQGEITRHNVSTSGPAIPAEGVVPDDYDYKNQVPVSWGLYDGASITKPLISFPEIGIIEFDTQNGNFTPVEGPTKINATTVKFKTKTGGSHSFTDRIEYSPGKYQVLYVTPVKITWIGQLTETKEIDVNIDSPMSIGQSKQVNAKIKTKPFNDSKFNDWVPIHSDPETDWESSDSSVVSINSSGYITAKKEGTVTITATWTKEVEVQEWDEAKKSLIKVNKTYNLSDSATITVGPCSGSGCEPTPDKSFTGDFEVTPSSIAYRDSFSLKPKDFIMNSCSYLSHQYKIERGGLSWTSTPIYGKSTTSSYSLGSYPYVIGVGSHNVSMKVKTLNCGESEWIGSKTLTVTGPPSNSPPEGKIGFVKPSDSKKPLTEVIEGTVLDLILIQDPSVPTPSDPDGDSVTFDGFDFSTSDAWSKDIPNKSIPFMDGYHSITMNGLGYHTVKAIIRDQWGLTTTLSTTINVVPENPVPVIKGSTEVVEGRPLNDPLNADNSYSPMGRTIDHSKDIWTNKKSVYTTVGTEVVTLEVFDSSGMKSKEPARHNITVKPDLPPIPQLDYIPTAVRNNELYFTNTSYSPDRDAIVSNSIYYQYDANNDGVFNEANVPVSMDTLNRFAFKPTIVGKYQFTITVVEDWGKQATGRFVVDVVNDSPVATFNLKSTISEPTIAPFTYVAPSDFVSNSWGRIAPSGISLGKRWVVDPNEGSIVSTSLNTPPPTYNPFRQLYRFVPRRTGFAAPSSTLLTNTLYYENGLSEYIGDGYVVGRFSDYNGIFHTVITKGYGQNERKEIRGLTLYQYDFANEVAYGIMNNTYVAIRFSDLKGPANPPTIYQSAGAASNDPYRNPLLPPDMNQTWYELLRWDSGYDIKTLVGQNTVHSYMWNSLSAYKTQTLNYQNQYPFEPPYYHVNYNQGYNYPVVDSAGERTYHSLFTDKEGNAYKFIYTYLGTAPTYNRIVKIGSSGNVEWTTDLSSLGISWNYNLNRGVMKVDSDGDFVYVELYNGSDIWTHYLVKLNIRTGQLLGCIGVHTFIGVSNGVVITTGGMGGELSGYDSNFSLIWRQSNPYSYLPIEISKDGYLTYITGGLYERDPVYPSLGGNKAKLGIVNIRDGSTEMVDLGFYMSRATGTNQSESIYEIFPEWIGDGTLFVHYTIQGYYNGNTSGTPSHRANLYQFATKNSSENVNEGDASGQLHNPSLITSDGEYTFDLKFNQKPDKSRFAGFGFRIQDANNLYRVEILDGTVKLVKYVNGVRNIIATSSYQISLTTYTTYKVRNVGNNIKVYVSGTPIIDVNDSQFSAAGSFGIYSASPRAEFKNVGYKLLGGGTAITYDNVALVGDNVTYSSTYADPESDPKIDSLAQWTFMQTNASKFLNAGDGKSGTSPLHNKTVQSPYLSFDKVGIYQVSYRLPDDPNVAYAYPSMAFNDYRKFSDPYSQYIVVHRKPISLFSIAMSAGKVVWTDNSYDPDRWLSSSNYSTEDTGINYQTTRGILEKKFYYIAPSGNTVTAKLVTPTELGAYTVGMAVKDEYGAWSNWYEQTLNVTTLPPPNAPPVPGFTLSSINTYRGVGVTITSTASDAEDGGSANLAHEYYIRNTSGGTETLQSTNRSSWVKTFNTLGVYTVRQVVEDSKGATAQIVKQITISNRLPTANVTTPTSTDQYAPTKLIDLRPNFTWTYSDADGDNETQYEMRIMRYGGTPLTSSGIKTGATTNWKPNADLPEHTNLYVQVRVFDGYDWSSWSAAKFFYIETNRAPEGDFTWSPTPVYEGDTVQVSMAVTDPDNDALTVDFEIISPAGTKTANSYTRNAPYSGQSGPSVRMQDTGWWTITMTVSDGKASPVIVTKTVRVWELGLSGAVNHTAAWEQNRIAYNQANDPDRPKDMFWAGEAFVLEAVATDTGSSSTKATNITVRAFNNQSKALISADSTRVEWSALLRSADTNIDFSKLEDGEYTFVFTATYSNGTVKTDTVTITIHESVDSYVGVHRLH